MAGVEKSSSIRYGVIVRGNLIEIMHNACALNIPDSLTRNLLSRDRIKFRERIAIRVSEDFGGNLTRERERHPLSLDILQLVSLTYFLRAVVIVDTRLT